MRRRIAWVLVLALGVVATGAAAATHERVGARINLFAGPVQTFPANQPFHISHGWLLSSHEPSKPMALGKYSFSLAVDGQEQEADYVDRTKVEHPDFGTLHGRAWVHNFPDGMTGTHTFTGTWTGPCAGLVAGGFTSGPCKHQNDIVTSGTLTVTVVFTP